jgi:hypothetical protein
MTSITALLAENREVRGQRDVIDAEREMLAGRLLKWMAPGQYLEHAAAAGYDITQDPLIRIKREQLLIDNDYNRFQKEHGFFEKSRKLDPNQTVVEQAYAAAFSARWGLRHQPHRTSEDVRWLAVGFLLDERSEAYPLRLAQRGIDWGQAADAGSVLRSMLGAAVINRASAGFVLGSGDAHPCLSGSGEDL